MRFFTICLCSLLLPLSVPADDFGLSEKSTGLEIVSAAKAKDTGWQDQQVDGQMVISRGRLWKREFSAKLLEDPIGGDKSVVVINYPPDQRGTVLLVHVNPGPDDNNLWIYIPEQRRVRRIADAARTSAFVSSHFANEDFTPLEVADFNYERLPDEVFAGETCFAVAAYPVDQFAGYSKLVVLFDQVELRIFQVRFFNRENQHIKTLIMENFQQYAGKFWRPSRVIMTEEQTGETTEILWNNYRFGVGLTEKDFQSTAMERHR